MAKRRWLTGLLGILGFALTALTGCQPCLLRGTSTTSRNTSHPTPSTRCRVSLPIRKIRKVQLAASALVVAQAWPRSEHLPLPCRRAIRSSA
jgi:hypothetical protein